MKSSEFIKFALYLIIASAFSQCLFAQSGIVLHKYDISAYPSVKTEVYVFDKDVDYPLQSYGVGDFVVLDNGIVPNNVNYINPSQNLLSNVSIDISFDLGLEPGIDQPINRFKIGKDFVQKFVSIIDSNKIELALTSFDAINYLNQDLTFSKYKILNSLSTLTSSEGSMLDEAFIDKPAGASQILKTAKYPRNLLLITDGTYLVDKQRVMSEISTQDIKVFVCVIGTYIGNDLKDIVLQSGGWYIDNIDETIDLSLLTKYFYSLIMGFKPSELSWENEISCNDIRQAEINLASKNYQSKFTYQVINMQKPIIVSNPKFLGFSSVIPGSYKDLDIVLTAINSKITITKLYIQDPRFTIIQGNNTPITLDANQSHILRIRFQPTDSAITFTTLQITSDACLGNEIYITGGFPNTPPVDRTVKLLTPECGSTLVPKDTFSIRWTGLLPSDVVQLEYSINNGQKWDTLAKNLTDLVYKWTVPDVVSDSCLVRIVQLWPNNVGRTMDLPHSAEVNSAFFNNDETLAITASSDKTVVVWNSNTGKKIYTLIGHSKPVNYAIFNTKADRAVSAGEDGNVVIWDITNGTKLYSKNYPNINIHSARFSHNDKYIVISCSTGYIDILDANDLSQKAHIIAYNNGGVCWYSEFSPDDKFILTAGNNGVARVWDWQNNTTTPVQIYDTRIGGYGNVIHATYNSLGNKIAVTALHSKRVYVFSAPTGNYSATLDDTLFSITHNEKPEDNIVINSVSFYNGPTTGEVFLSAGQDNVRLWDANFGYEVPPHIIQEHTESIRTAVFNFDAKRILTASWDFTAKIWNLEQRALQMDTTDCPFRIKPIAIELKPIEFAATPVNDSRDSTVDNFLVNKTDFNFEIRELKLVNQSGDFKILQNFETPFILDTLKPFSLSAVFQPNIPGFIADSIKILTPSGYFSAPITGVGIDRGLYSYSNLIDFGQVELGDTKDTVIDMLIINKSISDVQITKVSIQKPDTTHFSILEDITNQVLPPNGTIGVKIRYNPSAIEINNGTLTIEHTGTLSPLKVGLLGEGILPRIDTLTVVAGNITGAPSDIVELPIYIKNLSQYGIRPQVSGIQVLLTFNSTLLEPIDYYPNWFDGENRVMKINLPTTFGADSILTKIRFLIALGNDSLSTLKLSEATPIGKGKMKISTEDGKFILTGFCRQGGPRLFDPFGKLYLNESNPNPITSIGKITFSLKENGWTKLSIVDLTGKTIKVMVNDNLDKGEYTIYVNASEFPSGTYRYVLETPTQKLSKGLIIQR
jgi:WD40 repeat protein